MPTLDDGELQCEVNFSEQNFGPLSWMMRPCEWYYDEYRDCKSLRGRIHQYFVLGHTDSCDSWREDYTNCKLFRQNKDPQYLNKVIESELDRKAKRFEQSRLNDTWEYRREPPADWDKPLKK